MECMSSSTRPLQPVEYGIYIFGRYGVCLFSVYGNDVVQTGGNDIFFIAGYIFHVNEVVETDNREFVRIVFFQPINPYGIGRSVTGCKERQ